MQKYLFMALGLGLILLSIIAFEEGKPTPKSPIYKEIKKYSPYYLEKNFGGLQIMSKTDKEFKEKPSNRELFRRLEYLEKEWAKKHLKIIDKHVIINDDNGTNIAKIKITTEKDTQFMHSFYGL